MNRGGGEGEGRWRGRGRGETEGRDERQMERGDVWADGGEMEG